MIRRPSHKRCAPGGFPLWEICGQASDGQQAVEQGKLLLPNLIIMDVSMPNMNGIEVTRIIRAEGSASRILIMSQNDLQFYVANSGSRRARLSNKRRPPSGVATYD